MKIPKFVLTIAALAMFSMAGCGGDDGEQKEPPAEGGDGTAATDTGTTDPTSWPSFTVAPSEYPSWSTLMTAGKAGFINPERGGEPGTIETQYQVDIVLDVNDYDTCLQKYGTGAVDAVCITNTDILQIAKTRPSTAICPTSTSDGADVVISTTAKTLEELKTLTTYGLEKSVSQFQFVASLKAKGENPADYKFENLDPEAAATALQTGSNDVKSIAVWNPFALQTLRKTKTATRIMDSTAIPEQIIDMIVVSQESLAKPGGQKFADALCATFYAVNEKLADPKTADATTRALGEDFSSLNLEDMKICLTETSFYSTPQDGSKLFESEKFQNTTMPAVIETCQEITALEGDAPTIGYNDPTKQLNFDTTSMQRVAAAN
jgi:ABC-type nitrate/sulfonate/bicarbonate transport system substrate-binding protein